MHGRDGRREPASAEGAERDGAPGQRSLVARRYPALAQALPAGGEPPSVHDAATAAVDGKDAGAPVDASVAGAVGAHLGADFSAVRVHQDPLAQEATQAMGARAFAYGADVFLGPGEHGGDLALMAHELTHVAQQGAAGQRLPLRQVQVGAADSPAEREADQVAGAVTAGAPPAALIVDDGPVQPGQMLKSTFLEQLRAVVTAVAADELGPMGSVIGCPYLDQYFGRYASQPAAAGEALLKRFAPATRGARSAAELIPAVAVRVREGVRTWRDTGQPPTGLAEVDPGAADAAVSAGAAAGAGAGGTPAALPARSLASLEHELGAGAPLDGATASRMSDALGADVSAARIHTGPVAARLAAERQAMAFAVGEHVVLGGGAPAAGTVEGDALLAHELAHVSQQAAAARDPAARRAPIGAESSAAEHDADGAAAAAVAHLHGGPQARGWFGRLGAALRSDLQLQRCSESGKKVPTVAVATEDDKRKAAVEELVKQGKHEQAVFYICNAYGFMSANLEVKIVDDIDGAWATTTGSIGEGETQLVKVRKNLFEKDWAFIVRTIGHEFQHVTQRSQKDPVTNQAEREFLAWAWEALDTTAPAYDAATKKVHAKKALEYYAKMPDDRKKAHEAKKTQLEALAT